ncbi:MAG: hypothetical protein AAFR61_18805 [Bacteroidota bacterium]
MRGETVTLASSRANSSGGPGNRSLQLRATYQRSWTISSADAEPSPAVTIRCYRYHRNPRNPGFQPGQLLRGTR